MMSPREQVQLRDTIFEAVCEAQKVNRDAVLLMPELPNILLDYKVIVVDMRTEEEYHADGANFFKDEHGIQWVKFVPKNGYHIGHEHMIQSADVRVIRN